MSIVKLKIRIEIGANVKTHKIVL